VDEYFVKSWAGFEGKVAEISDRYGIHKVPAMGREYQNTILYRGQADYDWHLRTTLERYSGSMWTVERYMELVLKCAPQIESSTNQSWGLLSINLLKDELKRNSDYPVYVTSLRFLIYLRHHGFPSPLLDWTNYPYIAAFFAFAEQNNAQNAAVFAYIGAPHGTRGAWEYEPYITTLPEKVPTHRRHSLQRARYTVCTQMKEELQNAHMFLCHEKVFEKNSPRQDKLIKIGIPRTQRMDFLRRLDDAMNINDYALFLSEESLMKTLAFREIEKAEQEDASDFQKS
jgi:hypothetical protein